MAGNPKCKVCGKQMVSLINTRGSKCRWCNLYYTYDPLIDQWIWLQPWQQASQDESATAYRVMSARYNFATHAIVETIPEPANATSLVLVELPNVSTVVEWVRAELIAQPELVRMDVRSALLIISDFCVALKKAEIK